MDIQIESIENPHAMKLYYDLPYRVEVACLQKKENLLTIFNFKDKNIDFDRSISLRN